MTADEVVRCNECGEYHLANEMTDDKRMCKDCYIKWLETDFVKMRTEKLEAQIEKMKCCSNCYNYDEPERCAECKNLSKWEIKEK